MPLNPINVGSAPNDNSGDTLRDAFIKVNSNCTYLDGKAPNAHTHPLSDITQSGAAVGNVPVWNGTAWVPQAGGGALADGNKGDITVSNVGATWTINNNAVTGDKIASSTISSAKLGSDITASGKALLVAASAADQRSSLGLGTAAVVNVPAAGDASATEAVIGSDTRLTNSRTPLSHVHGNISNTGAIGSTQNLPLITGASGVVTTGTFGTAANTFCQGNDSRLSDPRTPLSHTHGNITNSGTIGSTASLPLITGVNGIIQVGSFGSSSGTFCQGNDSRLSDPRSPLAHSHDASDIISGTLGVNRIPTGSTDQTVCIGNDARLSDARTPTAHTHALSDLTQSSATTGQVIAWNGTAWAPAAASAGSVTSVGLALPNIFTVSNSPVTGSGTLTGVLATQAAATVFAGPTTGANAAPTFRALVAGDIPSLPYEASGSIATHAALTNGVHGITTWAAGLVSQIMASGARGYLGLGTAAVANTGDFDAAGAAASAVSTHASLTSGVHGISNFIGTTFLPSNSAPAARTNLGLGTSAIRDDSYFALAAHSHGNITSAGAIGTTNALPLITGASGVIETGSWGTTIGTFCQGNDARLSDARTPLAHTHAVGDLTQSGATSGQVIGWNGTAWAPTTVTSGSGGNISGPNSGITDNAIVRWDTNNTTIQNSVVTISDTGEFVGANSVAFSTSPSGSSAIGKVIWDTTNKTLSLGIGAGSVAALLGVDSHILVRNTTGTQINKGQVVRVNGASSGNMTVALAQGNNDANTTTTIGVAAENIANSGTGMVVTTGILGGLDTSIWAAGDMLFVSATTAGLLVNAAPTAPNHAVRMGYVVSSNPNSGIIYVNVDNGYELDELHDVAYPTAVANNDFLVYTTNRWENKTPANARAALGLGTLATQSGTFSGTSSGNNTGDQTITLTGDVTGTGTGSFAATIAAGAVGTSKLGGDITTAGKALLDDADAAAQRTTLGLGSVATLSSISLTSNVTETLPVANGGTGATTFTQGQVLFAGASSISSSANLFWDNANNSLGIGTATPAATLDVRASNGVGAVFLRTTNPAAAVASAYIQAPVSTGFSSTVPIYGFWYQNSGLGNPASDAVSLITGSTERFKIVSDGVCTWSNVGGVAGTAMTLNGTGLGIGIGPTHPLTVNGTIRLSGGNGTKVTWATDASSHFIQFSSTLNGLIVDGYDGVQLQTRSTPRVTVDSSGNVGIGTATPLFKLDVRGGSIYVERSSNPTNGTLIQASNQTTTSNNGCKISFDSYNIGAAGAGVPSGAQALAFYVGGVADANEKARIDTAGNLGLGVTPSAGVKLQLPNAELAGWAGTSGYLVSNTYYGSGDFRYVGTGAAARYQQVSGAHAWLTAPSGTAGNAITFTQAMTLDASGRLLLGAVSVPDTGLSFYNSNGTVGLGHYLTSTVAYVGTWTNHALALASNGSERLRIKSTGQLNFVGLASDPAGAAGDVVYNSTSNQLKYHNGTSWVSAGGGSGSANVWIPAAQWIPRTTTGCGIDSRELTTNKINTDELLFDAATVEYAQAIIVMPSNYNAGTVTAKFHWTASTGSGDVVWGLKARSYANDDAIDQAMGTGQTATDTLTATNDLDISPATSAITIGGTVASGNPVIFEVYRDAAAGGDTLGADARLLGVEITYTAA